MAAQRNKASAGQQESILRQLPAVDRVLENVQILDWAKEQGFDRSFLRRAANHFLDDLRGGIREGTVDTTVLEERLSHLAEGVAAAAEHLLQLNLRAVINATGVVVHTNLGRSPWSAAAADRVATLSRRYLNLEFDIEAGKRGGRDAPVERLFQQILPDAGVAVVNNNAAAVLLVLNTLADGKEVVVSRGQLVEIGGSFRIPEVMAKSGSILREVGTTNRTHKSDYEAAINANTGLLLAVHPSNYRVVGFTEGVSLEELADLGKAHGVPVVEDMGSGNLLDLGPFGIPHEPSVGERLASGVDLVTFSGDKLLGGPQVGFIAGKPEFVQRTRTNPLFRALRLDKATFLAIEATLAAYVAGQLDEIPTVAMLKAPREVLQRRAEGIAKRLRAEAPEGQVAIEVVEVNSRVGGGAAPETDLPSFAVSVESEQSPDRLATALRRTDPPVIARILDDRLVMDVRTVQRDEEDELVAAVASVLTAD
jgi:L-seryl-tRNA(Ser) seleniumtransferase